MQYKVFASSEGNVWKNIVDQCIINKNRKEEVLC